MPNSETNPLAVILTAIPVEYKAVRAHLVDVQEETRVTGEIYERGKFSSEGKQWDVGIVEVGAGNADAAIAAERAITHFQPIVMFFVGIAGGLKDVKIGDVVAATKVYGYASGRANAKFEPRPDVNISNFRLGHRAKAESKKKGWLKRIQVPLPDSDRLPNVLVAPIASGDQVIASTDSDTWNLLRSHYGDAVAVEMEGHGFLHAVRAYSNIYALIIRGISDLIDGKSETDANNSQDTAARHASAFAFEILAKLDIAELQKNIEFSVQKQKHSFNENVVTRDISIEQSMEHEILSNKTDTMSLTDYLARTEKMSAHFNGTLEVFSDTCEKAIKFMEKLETFLQNNYKLDTSSTGLMTSNIIEEIKRLVGELHDLGRACSPPKQRTYYNSTRTKVYNSFNELKANIKRFNNTC